MVPEAPRRFPRSGQSHTPPEKLSGPRQGSTRTTNDDNEKGKHDE